MRFLASILSIPILLSACADATPRQQSVTSAWVRLPAVAGNPAAGYFSLAGGSVSDRLMSVSSPLAVRAELHDMTMAGGMMKMAEIKGGVEVAVGKPLDFAPGGKHVMLFDVSPQATAGRTMPLRFVFASGVEIEHAATIVAAGDAPPIP